MGHLIPAGTGYPDRLKFEIKKVGREVAPDIPMKDIVSDDTDVKKDESKVSEEDATSLADAISVLGLDDGDDL